MGLAAAALVGALTLAACGSSDSGSSSGGSGSGGSAAPSNLKVGMAYDIGGRGDKSFNDAAAAGLDKAKSRPRTSTSRSCRPRASETDTDQATRLELLARAGYNPVIAVGFAYADPRSRRSPPKYPDIKFAIIDARRRRGAERDQPGLRRGAGLLPGRRGRRR